METVVRATFVLRTAMVTVAVLSAALTVLTMVRSDRPGWSLLWTVVFALVWGFAVAAIGKRPPFDIQVTAEADLPRIEPERRTVAKIVAAHTAIAVVFIGLLLIPVGSDLGIPAGIMLGMIVLYARALRRIEAAETDGGGTIWSTSTFAWNSTQATARKNYLVPANGAPVEPDPAPAGD